MDQQAGPSNDSEEVFSTNLNDVEALARQTPLGRKGFSKKCRYIDS